MSLLPFMNSDDRTPQAARLAPKLRALAERGVFFGTSSWKYDGWLGSIYDRERYASRGRFSRRRFETECLAEYAETFPIVCGDFAFYQFPSPDYWRRLFEGTPSSFAFAFKVPEDITVAHWPEHARYGAKAGTKNEAFLDAGLFRSQFIEPLKPYAGRVGPLVFEFGTFSRETFPRADDFVSRLDPFLAALPEGFRYAIEIRNPDFLGVDYTSTLAAHGVAHVFNAWTRMPELGAQLALPGAFTADFTVVRALLSRGRTYEQAVNAFSPYDRVQAPNLPAREAMKRIAEHAIGMRRPAFLFVNNRLEGNAPTTIEAVADALGFGEVTPDPSS